MSIDYNLLRMKRNILVIVALLFVTISYAQSDVQEVLKRHAAEKVGQLCDYIEFLANPQNEYKTRIYYKTKALNLFINKGEEYEENGIYKKGVIMEVISTSHKRPLQRLMKDYFTGLMNMRYSKVSIESMEVSNVNASSLQQIDDSTYVCTCYFEQVFCGYREGKPVYKDITRKKVKCYVTPEISIDEEGHSQYEPIIILGDITALETIRIN